MILTFGQNKLYHFEIVTGTTTDSSPKYYTNLSDYSVSPSKVAPSSSPVSSAEMDLQSTFFFPSKVNTPSRYLTSSIEYPDSIPLLSSSLTELEVTSLYEYVSSVPVTYSVSSEMIVTTSSVYVINTEHTISASISAVTQTSAEDPTTESELLTLPTDTIGTTDNTFPFPSSTKVPILSSSFSPSSTKIQTTNSPTSPPSGNSSMTEIMMKTTSDETHRISTMLDTTTFTPIVTTCPNINLSRPEVGLNNQCGEHSISGKCIVPNSVCIMTDITTIWECRCSYGYIQENASCKKGKQYFIKTNCNATLVVPSGNETLLCFDIYLNIICNILNRSANYTILKYNFYYTNAYLHKSIQSVNISK